MANHHVDGFFKYKTAVVRGISASLPTEALRLEPSSEPVSWKKAVQQHDQYVTLLREQLGLTVIELPVDDDLPDCVFVEDVVVAIGNSALITTPGHVTRRPETVAMEKVLEDLGMNLIWMKKEDPGALMDGGDVLFTGQEIFVGISKRTNKSGFEVLEKAFPQFSVTPVPVEQGLHLKSCCSLAKPGVILVGVGNQVDKKTTDALRARAKGKYQYIPVEGDGIGANCLYIDSPKLGSTVVCPSSEVFPESKKAYATLSDVQLISCDLCETTKVDGALTCSSVLLTVEKQIPHFS